MHVHSPSGVVLAAGTGTRLRPLTNHKPKCLVEVGPRTILASAVDAFGVAGITKVVVATGYKAEMIESLGFQTVFNPSFGSDNVLGTFHAAGAAWRAGAVCCYGDIIFSPRTVVRLLDHPCDISIAVDTNWKNHYRGRTLHPTTEAELAISKDGYLLRSGKGLPIAEAEGEFLGLFKISHSIGDALWMRLDELIQKDPRVREKYLTAFFNHLVEFGWKIATVECGEPWQEIDTVEDLERFGSPVSLRGVDSGLKSGGA